ncbi:uncharacterized protein LODBEIA_P07230 [Lodderomyces beijingensis]|uniref:NAD(P)-binding domain-containing protein n=1 Tax=Lodderomyces beijingensis TaxID=1775926 RepID=A0ABP0ZF84_9ASCO
MSSLLVLGSTGLVGTEVIKHGQESQAFNRLITLTRRQPNFATTTTTTGEETKIESVVEPNTSTWPTIIKDLKPGAHAYISAFGTTRAKAGSSQNFKDIDYGINYESAKAAKAQGAKVCVLVSAYGASAKSPFLYMKTKGELEDAIIALKFPYTIILRPGVLLGERKEAHGFANDWAQKIGGWIQGTWFSPLMQPIDASDVGKIAIDFAQRGLTDDLRESVLTVSGAELNELVNDFKVV